MQGAKQPWTINGIHLNAFGDEQVAKLIDEALFGPRPPSVKADLARLRREVDEKNLQFFYDYRAVNGFYIYGGRKNPFGIVNFPAEFAKLRKMIANRDQRIWAVAHGEDVPATIDDSNTGEFRQVETNYKAPIIITTPEDERAQVPACRRLRGQPVRLGSRVSRSEEARAVRVRRRGRLWVCTMPSYPMYLPGTPVNDKVLIFEDTNGDGTADKQTVFADKLHVPTGIELGDGGAYVAQQPNLMFLKDTDGDDQADTREIVLHGFDSADSHHSISAFTWDPGGALVLRGRDLPPHAGRNALRPAARGRRRASSATNRGRRSSRRSSRTASPIRGGTSSTAGDRTSWPTPPAGRTTSAPPSPATSTIPHKHGDMKEFLTKQWRPTSRLRDRLQPPLSRRSAGQLPAQQLHRLPGHAAVQDARRRLGLRRRPGRAAAAVDRSELPPGRSEVRPGRRAVRLRLVQSADRPHAAFDCAIRIATSTTAASGGSPTRAARWSSRRKSPARRFPQLLDLLKTYEDRTRYRVRRELRDRETATRSWPTLNKWIAGLDSKDAGVPAPSARSALDAPAARRRRPGAAEDVAPLARLPRAGPRPRACSATGATASPTRWRCCSVQVNDEHPRVRLEAVRALSFFHDPQATEVALETLGYPQDDYLEYTLKETLNTLERREKQSQK